MTESGSVKELDNPKKLLYLGLDFAEFISECGIQRRSRPRRNWPGVQTPPIHLPSSQTALSEAGFASCELSVEGRVEGVLNSRFGLPEGLARAFGAGENSRLPCGFQRPDFGRFGNRQIFFKKHLARNRMFDILCAQFRLKAGPGPRWRAAASNQAEGQQLQTDN